MWSVVRSTLSRSRSESGRATAPSRSRRRVRFTPRLEPLDPRDVPAVNAYLDGDVLRVLGDEAPNQIAIVDRGNTAVKVYADNQKEMTFTDVREIKIYTAGGDDVVTYQTTDPKVRPTNLTVRLGDGADQFTAILAGTETDGQKQGWSWEVDGGAGNDVVSIIGPEIIGPEIIGPEIIGPEITVTGGSGDDKITLEDLPFPGQTELSMAAGSGADAVSFLSNSFHGPTSVNFDLGGGDDQLTTYMNTFDGTTMLGVDAGDGNNTVSFLCNGALTADIGLLLGAGNDTATFEENTFGTLNLNVDAGKGDDAISFRCNGALSAGIGLLLDAGNDTATFEENTYNGPLQLRVDAGSGDDAVPIRCDWMQAGANIAISLGAGDDQLPLYMNRFDRATLLTLDAGDGADAVSMQCDAFNGMSAFGIDLGAGADELRIDETSVADSFAVKADAGDGDDRLIIDGTSTVGSKAAVSYVTFGGAGRDQINVEACQTGTSVAVSIDGGDGDDRLAVTFASRLPLQAPTTYAVMVAAGDGRDQVVVNVGEKASWLFNPSVLVLATGTGNDRLELNTGQLIGQRPDGTTFQVFADGGAGSDTLVGPQDVEQEWRLEGINNGRLNGNIRFVSFENLVGGELNDTFIFLPGSFLSGSIDGGGDYDTIDYRPRGSRLGAGPSSSFGIEQVLF